MKEYMVLRGVHQAWRGEIPEFSEIEHGKAVDIEGRKINGQFLERGLNFMINVGWELHSTYGQDFIFVREKK